MAKILTVRFEIKMKQINYNCNTRSRQKSNDKTQSKDISALSKEFYKVVNKKRGEVLPFFVVSMNYNEITKDFELLIGGLLVNDNLQAFTIPRGVYAKVTVNPKMGFLWVLSIGGAKRVFIRNGCQNMDMLPIIWNMSIIQKSVLGSALKLIFYSLSGKLFKQFLACCGVY